MKRFMIALLLVSIVLFSVPPAAAQDQGKECAPDELTTWQNRTFDIFTRYQQVILQGSGLETVANLQALRRDLEAIVVPDCAVTPTPALMAKLINLKADALVLQALQALSGNTSSEAQAIQNASDQAYADVDGIFAGLPIVGTSVTTAITYPPENTAWPLEINIQGTYNPADIGDNDLWLFVFSPNSRYYPQVSDACTTPQTITLREGHNTWNMTAYLGAEPDRGATFELYLGTLTPDKSEELLARFPGWCANNWVGAGMTESELYDDYGFVELDSTILTREM